MVFTVFDIGNLYVKGREWKVGKRRSRGLYILNDRDRNMRETGRKRKGGEGEERERSTLL